MSRDDRNLVRLGLVGALCAVVAGCSQSDPERHAEMDKLRAFLQEERSPVVGVPYRVLPPDVLSIQSRYVREIDGAHQRVRPDGKITLPLLGDVFVAGKTVQEIGYEIAWAARRYYNRVDVTVSVVEYNSQKIYVFGQVGRAGWVPWTGSDTVLDILARAQPTLLAWPENIKIVRGQKPQRGGYEQFAGQLGGPDDAKQITVDLMAMVKSGDMSKNVLLKPDDIVYVPANIPGSIGLFLRQLLYPVNPVMEAMYIPKNAYHATKIKDDDDGYNY